MRIVAEKNTSTSSLIGPGDWSSGLVLGIGHFFPIVEALLAEVAKRSNIASSNINCRVKMFCLDQTSKTCKVERGG